MTNFEYIKDKINNIDDPKEFAYFVLDCLNKHQWCVGSGENYGDEGCSPRSCATHWLKKEHCGD